jgi:hypothetical protein
MDARQEPTFDRSEPAEAPLRRRRNSMAPYAIPVLVFAVAAGGLWLWRQQMPAVLRTTANVPAADPGVAQAEPDKAPPALPTAVLPATAEELVKAEDVTAALTRLLGRDAVLRFVETTDFPRRFVATLDNLAREHAPVTTWPVVPAPGQFQVAKDGSSQVIAPQNARRYDAFVAFVGFIDTAQAVDLYRRMYPVLQQAYRDLGFGNRSLHERVFQVIDVLLATPEPQQAPKISLTEVKGPIRSERPWTRYQYDDPGFERLTSGQKLLLRMGPDHRKALKAKLEDVRRQLLQVSTEASR